MHRSGHEADRAENGGRRGIDMLKGFANRGHKVHQADALSNVATAPGFNAEGRANVTPAFEAWLRTYLRRLEQVRESSKSPGTLNKAG
jgi:hypothetical protein